MQQYVLQQSNGAPVKFNGEMIAETGEPEVMGPYTRWHEIAIYRTESERFVVYVRYKSNAKDSRQELIEPEVHDVFVCDRECDVVEVLGEYNPTEFLQGYPEGIANYAKKMAKLRSKIVADYERSVGDALWQASQTFEEFAEPEEV